MNGAERLLCEWQDNRTGHFFTALFECMAKADGENLARLEAGFPTLVAAWRRFKAEDGYFDRLWVEYIAERLRPEVKE